MPVNLPQRPEEANAEDAPRLSAMFPLSRPEDWENLRAAANRGLATQPHVGLAVAGAKVVGEGVFRGGKALLETTKQQLDTSEGVKVGAGAAPASTMVDVADIFPLSGLMGISGKLALAANAPLATSGY
jgi:hypothetical protein